MKGLSLKEAAAWLGTNTAMDVTVTDIVTDSRKVIPGSIFVALRGEKFDGHDFIADVFEKGAAAAVSERSIPNARGLIIEVQSAGKALLMLAEYYGAKFNIPKVGLTGSVGKTTTKEMTAAVLAGGFETLKTEGNYNNEIGVPLTLFRLGGNHQAAVIEMGMSSFGEISRLSSALHPDVGMITNIGVAHIEHLGSRRGILQAKMEILDGMKKTAPLIINGDDPLLLEGVAEIKNPVVSCGIRNRSADFTAEEIEIRPESTTFLLRHEKSEYSVWIPAAGEHNVYNAMMALAAGYQLGISIKKGIESLKNYVPAGMRQRVVRENGYVIIEDCYNASPDSVKAAIRVLDGMLCEGSRIAVLGDMLELGGYSEEAHRQCGEEVGRSTVDMLVTYGKESVYYAEEAEKYGKETKIFENKEALTDFLLKTCQKGDILLFKASRGMRLEEVLQAFRERW